MNEENISKNVLFANYISGIKTIPLNTLILMVNDIPNNLLTFTFELDGKKMMKFDKTSIKNISYRSRVQIENTNKKPEENETKSALLGAALFGGNPLMQLAGSKGINGLFNGLSNNYDKVDYSSYYEITIEVSINNQDLRILLRSDDNPEEFINQIKDN
jgi:hypothetical protein